MRQGPIRGQIPVSESDSDVEPDAFVPPLEPQPDPFVPPVRVHPPAFVLPVLVPPPLHVPPPVPVQPPVPAAIVTPDLPPAPDTASTVLPEAAQSTGHCRTPKWRNQDWVFGQCTSDAL